MTGKLWKAGDGVCNVHSQCWYGYLAFLMAAAARNFRKAFAKYVIFYIDIKAAASIHEWQVVPFFNPPVCASFNYAVIWVVTWENFSLNCAVSFNKFPPIVQLNDVRCVNNISFSCVISRIRLEFARTFGKIYGLFNLIDKLPTIGAFRITRDGEKDGNAKHCCLHEFCLNLLSKQSEIYG